MGLSVHPELHHNDMHEYLGGETLSYGPAEEGGGVDSHDLASHIFPQFIMLSISEGTPSKVSYCLLEARSYLFFLHNVKSNLFTSILGASR